MLETEVLHPRDLCDEDAAAWSAMQAATPAFSSPLLGPHFARAVGEVRADAAVAVFRRAGAAVGFLAHHRRPAGLGRPIGAPFSDYHALVAAPGEAVAPREALAGAGLAAFRFSGLIDPNGAFAGAIASTALGYRVVIDGPPQAYLRGVCAGSRNRAKNYRRYRGKLERDFGPLRLVAEAQPLALARLLDWKGEQIARTGITDFLSAPWTRGLLARLFEAREGAFQGLQLSLYAGERQVCSHFGVRLGAHYHPWISASDPGLRAYSPGFIHQWMAIEAMGELGLSTYDLGPGFGHWKALFASRGGLVIGAGLAAADSAAGRLAASCEGLWRLPAVARIEAVGRLRRRLDQIALSELTLGGRVAGMARAVAAYDRRNAARRPKQLMAASMGRKVA
jgi:CelD/BcsL family acetyltransferase involved in cellulose biosynthesis